jgi:hypothetical protein
MLLEKPAWMCTKEEYNDLEQKYWEFIRNLHFEEGGTPYWMEKAKEYGVNPKKDLAALTDFLNHEISLCNENELKEKPFGYFIPESVLKIEKNNIGIYTSSGSTGKKKNAPWNNNAFDYNSKFLSHVLDSYGIEKGSNFLIAGPSFPAPFQSIMEKLAKERNGLIYFAPIETRELKTYFSTIDPSRFDIESNPFLKARLSPSVEYQLDILGKEEIGVLGIALFSLPLFMRAKGFENVKLIYCGGMEIPSEQYRYWKKELEAMDKKIVTSYGHYMFGLIFDVPNEELTYYPPSPLSLLYVVKEDDPHIFVDYGERGRVRFLRMSEALLWSQPERDYAERVSPQNEFKWDGLKNITSSFQMNI